MRNASISIAAGLLTVLLVLPAFSQNKPTADLVITNANVYTVDRDMPHAEAVAISHGRIVAVGTSSEIDEWRGPNTKMIDGRLKLLLPGFNDAHVHFVSGGVQLDNVDLKNAESPDEFIKKIADRARMLPKGEWITDGNWDETKWNPVQLPTKSALDGVTADRPVFVGRYDGHMGLANSVALKLAGVTSKTSDPPGGVIVRDAQGEPTGILKDSAMNLVEKVIPPLSRDRRMRAARRAMGYAARLGVTSIQDMNSDPLDVSVYSELASKGLLTLRIYSAPPIANWADLAKTGVRHGFGWPDFRLGAVKAFADGSLGSTTAYFFDPYTDAPQDRGLLAEDMQPLSKIRQRMQRADAAGIQLCVHAIGDQAISIVLDLFSQVEKANGPADRRFRIEHAQHIAPKDFDRFATEHVIASVQPYQAIDDGRWAEARIGPERLKTTYAFRTLLDHGVRLAFGTDWTVAPLNPMLTLYAAVTRATLDDKNPRGWIPEQKISLAQAVEAYTMGSAYAEFQENEKGSITPGKLADLVFLSDDIFKIDPKDLPDVQVEMTIVGGKVVWSK